ERTLVPPAEHSSPGDSGRPRDPLAAARAGKTRVARTTPNGWSCWCAGDSYRLRTERSRRRGGGPDPLARAKHPRIPRPCKGSHWVGTTPPTRSARVRAGERLVGSVA